MTQTERIERMERILNEAEQAVRALDWFSALQFAAGFFVIRRWKLNPVAVIVGGGVMGGVIRLILGL